MIMVVFARTKGATLRDLPFGALGNKLPWNRYYLRTFDGTKIISFRRTTGRGSRSTAMAFPSRARLHSTMSSTNHDERDKRGSFESAYVGRFPVVNPYVKKKPPAIASNSTGHPVSSSPSQRDFDSRSPSRHDALTGRLANDDCSSTITPSSSPQPNPPSFKPVTSNKSSSSNGKTPQTLKSRLRAKIAQLQQQLRLPVTSPSTTAPTRWGAANPYVPR